MTGKDAVVLAKWAVALFMALAMISVNMVDSYPRPQAYPGKSEVSVERNESAPLLLEVYYESLCPDSVDFLLRQLLPVTRKIGNIVRVELIPFGKATWHRLGAEYIFRCHHGPPECKGNRIQTCGYHFLKQQNETAALEFVYCTMQAYDPSTVAERCAKKSGFSGKALLDCTRNSAGSHLQHKMALKTEALKPKLTWVPWLVIDGVHNDHIQRLGTSNLLHLLCSMYKGHLPNIDKELQNDNDIIANLLHLAPAMRLVLYKNNSHTKSCKCARISKVPATGTAPATNSKMLTSGKYMLVLTSLTIVFACASSKLHHKKNHHSHRRIRDAAPVLLEVYYETLCPDSRAFITNQLYPTLQQINSIMNVSMIPYGKATQKQDGDNWVFTCQHGPRECVGNVIQSCALKYLPLNNTDPATKISRVFTLINCMEAAKDPSSAGPDCASQQSIDFAPIDKCSKSSEGNQLEHTMGVRTESLDPKLTFVPWMVINGIHTASMQSRALYDLLGLICDTYTGPKPAACNE
ncbi:uncharacterized protein LOC129591395 [Paramacrobiotus metropolitanus]|uniref:uncharacterized protein LOC129591395 n=1 Tax=Paramacrobiotus metropolitanus TaxID=2943436 RepID=UPI0024460064|nr:uncharacterized protein LOC129591395 [Paramacrobiotus metropolitanus]